MPYELVKVNEAKSLYKVCKSDDRNKCFSKKPLRKFVAVKQKKAIELNERRRKTGGARKVNPRRWDSLYEQFKERAESLGVDEPFTFDKFKRMFSSEYNNSNIDSYEVVMLVAQMNYDQENQPDTDESSDEEKVKALSDEEIKARKEEKEKNETKNEAEFRQKRSELANRFYYGGLNMPLQYVLNPFFEKNLPPTAEVGFNVNTPLRNEIYVTQAELDDPNQVDAGLVKRKLLDEGDIIMGDGDKCLENNPSINVDILQNTYDYLIEISKKFQKGRMGFFVDASRVQDDNDVPNEDIIIGLTSVLQHVGNTENLCVDKCDPDEQYGFHVMGDFKKYGISLFVDANKNIVFTAGANISLRDNDKDLHINFLCGSTYAFTIFDAYKRMAATGQDYFWNGDPFEKLTLMSVADYNTVQFYYKQGMKNEKSKDKYRDGFQLFIKAKLREDYDDNLKGQLEFMNGLIQIFERPICKKMTETVEISYVKKGKRYKKTEKRIIPNSKILNDIYQNSGCGGDKYFDGVKGNDENLFDFNKLFKEECEFVIGDLEENIRKIEEAERRGEQKAEVKENRRDVATELKKDFLERGNKNEFFRPSQNLTEAQEAAYKPRKERTRSDYRNKPDLRDKILKAFNIGERRRENFEESGLADIKTGEGIKGVKFDEELRRYGINPTDYLSQMKKWAKASGYDEKQLTLDNNDKNKLRIMTEQGTKHFGRVGYKDYYIYRHLEKEKKVKKGYAKIMRDRFRKSHGAISKKRKLGRNSANELSLRILWHEDDDEKDKKKNEKAK